jgi:hypothetical protein
VAANQTLARISVKKKNWFLSPKFGPTNGDCIVLVVERHGDDFQYTILPTHSSKNVCLCTLDFKPRFDYKNFFMPVLLFCSFFPSSLLFCLQCHSLYSTTSNERMDEQTNERSVALLFSRHFHLLLTISNFLPFASFLFLLTLDRLRR